MGCGNGQEKHITHLCNYILWKSACAALFSALQKQTKAGEL